MSEKNGLSVYVEESRSLDTDYEIDISWYLALLKKEFNTGFNVRKVF